MENIIEAITANPVYLAIAVVLAIIVVYGFIKKGFKNVKQLKGGVINYANDVKSKKITSKFIGKNFVFDARLGESVTNDVLGKCYICNLPADKHADCNNQMCHILFLACSDCAKAFENCCSNKCKEIAALPIEKQRILRKIKK